MIGAGPSQTPQGQLVTTNANTGPPPDPMDTLADVAEGFNYVNARQDLADARQDLTNVRQDTSDRSIAELKAQVELLMAERHRPRPIEDELEESEMRLAAEAARVTALRDQLELEKDRHATELAALRFQLDDLRTEVSRKDGQIAAKNQQLAELPGIQAELSRKNRELAQKNVELATIRVQLQQATNNIQTDIQGDPMLLDTDDNAAPGLLPPAHDGGDGTAAVGGTSLLRTRGLRDQPDASQLSDSDFQPSGEDGLRNTRQRRVTRGEWDKRVKRSQKKTQPTQNGTLDPAPPPAKRAKKVTIATAPLPPITTPTESTPLAKTITRRFQNVRIAVFNLSLSPDLDLADISTPRPGFPFSPTDYSLTPDEWNNAPDLIRAYIAMAKIYQILSLKIFSPTQLSARRSTRARGKATTPALIPEESAAVAEIFTALSPVIRSGQEDAIKQKITPLVIGAANLKYLIDETNADEEGESSYHLVAPRVGAGIETRGNLDPEGDANSPVAYVAFGALTEQKRDGEREEGVYERVVLEKVWVVRE